MLERAQVVRHAALAQGSTVLEVGSGAHAIATVPLAFEMGSSGRVIAVERSRWNQFGPIMRASGLETRVCPVKADAGSLPFRSGSIDIAVCLHGIRSLGSSDEVVGVLQEMLRVGSRLVIAESLPLARNDAQQAHLMLYNLREQVFEAAYGRKDDRHYLPLTSLTNLVERAGGVVDRSDTVEVDLPHALAYFPRTLVEAIPDASRRTSLLREWEEANSLCERHGEDHPLVGIVVAHRS
jgi:ubiquinone/menaquinone biosynthesis C-methylase UbiE